MPNIKTSNMHRWYGVLFRAYVLDMLQKHLQHIADHLLSLILVSTV